MRDQDKPKAQLIIELTQAREQIAALEKAQEEYKRSGQKALELAIDEVKTTALKNFVGNLAGFVTTPLTLLKASLLALREIPAEDVQDEQWQILKSQVGYLERLFENMLLMVRLDNLNEIELSSINMQPPHAAGDRPPQAARRPAPTYADLPTAGGRAARAGG